MRGAIGAVNMCKSKNFKNGGDFMRTTMDEVRKRWKECGYYEAGSLEELVKLCRKASRHPPAVAAYINLEEGRCTLAEKRKKKAEDKSL